MENLGIYKKFNDRIKVYNLSSKTLDSNITQILERGPNFVFPNKKYNQLDDQIEAENLFSQISDISKDHNSK